MPPKLALPTACLLLFAAALRAEPPPLRPPGGWTSYAPLGQAEFDQQAKALIEHFKMQKIPAEGAWFAETWRSADRLPAAGLPARYGGKPHLAGTAIYALETREDFSALHRLQTDETYHFYGGAPLQMLLLRADGTTQTVVIGSAGRGQQPQFTVPRGTWQGSRPLPDAGAGAWSFFGCTLAPGFEYGDFEIGYRDDLQKAYPSAAGEIADLTRAEFARRLAGAFTPALAAPDPGPAAFAQDAQKPVAAGPGVALRELVGLAAPARSAAHSVAVFHLDKGSATAMSHNKVAEETILVTAGRGQVTRAGQSEKIAAGSVVLIPPGVSHSLAAAADAAEGLDFYAVSAPAYSPEDFVLDPVK